MRRTYLPTSQCTPPVIRFSSVTVHICAAVDDDTTALSSVSRACQNVDFRLNGQVSRAYGYRGSGRVYNSCTHPDTLTDMNAIYFAAFSTYSFSYYYLNTYCSRSATSKTITVNLHVHIKRVKKFNSRRIIRHLGSLLGYRFGRPPVAIC